MPFVCPVYRFPMLWLVILEEKETWQVLTCSLVDAHPAALPILFLNRMTGEKKNKNSLPPVPSTPLKGTMLLVSVFKIV